MPTNDRLEQHRHETTTGPGGGSSRQLRARRAKILVADDDAAMRALVAGTLRHDGFDVLDVETGGEAARLLEELAIQTWSTRPVDLVLTDVWMPGLSGLRLAELLRKARWSIPIIFMTAFPERHVRDEASQLEAPLLAKPFALASLRRLVIESLARHRRAAGNRDEGGGGGVSGAP